MVVDDLANLVQTARDGDAHAFDALVRRYQDFAFAAAWALVGDAHLAQDIAQEAFLQAYRDLPTLREPLAFSGWLRRIIFKYADRVRRDRRVPTTSLDLAFDAADDAPLPSAIAEANELRDEIQTQLAKLSERARLVVTLHYANGYAQREIAELLGVPPTTIKKRLFDARRRLKEHLMADLKDTLQPHQPSRNDEFARRVRFLVDVKQSNLAAVRQQLEADPTLVGVTLAREEWGQPEMGQPRLPMEFNRTPLHFAAKYGQLDLARLLLAHGAAVDDATPGETPLMVAAAVGDTAMAGLLLEHGADPNWSGPASITPLHRAEMRGYAELAAELQRRGADPALRDASGRIPADWAPRPPVKVAAPAHQKLLETGIKVIDLFAPLPRGGTIYSTAEAGVGKLVLLAELGLRLARRGGAAVYVSWRERYYRAEDAHRDLREFGAQTVQHTLVGTLAEPAPTIREAVEIAARVRDSGQDALLVVDATPDDLAWLCQVMPKLGVRGQGSITLLVYDLLLPNFELGERNYAWDARLAFDVALARQTIYPAVDPLRSSSRLLDSGDVSEQHRQVARQAHAALAAGGALAERLHWFSSQPFFVAEAYTARPGVYVPLQDTIDSYAALLAADDGPPVESLKYTGALSAA